MDNKKTISITLETARKWYKKGGDLKELALTAFTKDELITNKPEKDYDAILKKYADNYPIGRVIWSSDGTDELPNVIISKPFYIEEKMCFYGKVKTIVFKTIRISVYSNEVFPACIKVNEVHYKEDFERGIISNNCTNEPFSLDEYKKKLVEKATYREGNCEKEIGFCKKRILEYTKEKEMWTNIKENFNKIYNDLYTKARTYDIV